MECWRYLSLFRNFGGSTVFKIYLIDLFVRPWSPVLGLIKKIYWLYKLQNRIKDNKMRFLICENVAFLEDLVELKYIVISQ